MTDPPAERPSRTRYILVAWLFGLAWVLYLDRICWSQAVKPIREELELSRNQMGLVAMAFTLAYGIFEMPTGRLGDRVGPRFVLIRIVIWWSLFTALTGAAWGFTSLLVVRFLFGAGEAGAFPNAARVMTRWFPARERGRVQGIMLTAAQLGGVVAPTMAAFFIDLIGWRWTFVVFGSFGVFWAIGFYFWFRDNPADHPSVNAAEADLIREGASDKPTHTEPIPWRAVFLNTGIWLLGFAIICSSFNSYLYYSWFSTYLMEGRGIENQEAGFMSSLVLAGSGVGVLAGGVLADRILRSRNVVRSRRVLGGVTFVFAAAFLFAAVRMDDAWSMTALAACSCLCVQIILPTWWSAAIEQSGKHTGALFGWMNMMGLMGAALSQWFVGAYSDWRKGLGHVGRAEWDPMFDVFVGVLLLGAVAWAVYRKRPL
jgi:sugar phosphate permease